MKVWLEALAILSVNSAFIDGTDFAMTLWGNLACVTPIGIG